jgi:hypothetical protein
MTISPAPGALTSGASTQRATASGAPKSVISIFFIAKPLAG